MFFFVHGNSIMKLKENRTKVEHRVATGVETLIAPHFQRDGDLSECIQEM